MTPAESEAAIHGGYTCAATSALLGDEFVCPPVDARLVATYVERLSSEGRFALLAGAA